MSFMGWLGKHPLEAILGIGGAAFGLPEILGAGAAAGGGLTAAAGASAASPFALTAGTGAAAGMGGGTGLSLGAGAAGLSAPASSLSIGSLAPTTGGLFGDMSLKDAGSYAKNGLDAFKNAREAGAMFNNNITPIQNNLPHGDNGLLSQIVQSDQQGLLAQQDAEQKRRQQQMALIQGMGR